MKTDPERGVRRRSISRVQLSDVAQGGNSQRRVDLQKSRLTIAVCGLGIAWATSIAGCGRAPSTPAAQLATERVTVRPLVEETATAIPHTATVEAKATQTAASLTATSPNLCEPATLIQTPPVSPRRTFDDGVGPLRLLGHVGGNLQVTASDANRIYAGQGPRLVVFEKDVRGGLVPAGQVLTDGGTIEVIEAAGNIVYLFNVDPTVIWAVDVADASQPRVLGHTPIPTGLPTDQWRVERQGDTIFAAVVQWWGSALYAFDVSNPSKPRISGCVDLGPHGRGGNSTPDLALSVNGDHVDVLVNDHMVVVDARDPSRMAASYREWIGGSDVPARNTAASMAAALRPRADTSAPSSTPIAPALSTAAAQSGSTSDIGMGAFVIGPEAGDTDRSVYITTWDWFAKVALARPDHPLVVARPRYEDARPTENTWKLDYEPTSTATPTPLPSPTPGGPPVLMATIPPMVISDGFDAPVRWLERWEDQWLRRDAWFVQRYAAPTVVGLDFAAVAYGGQLFMFEPSQTTPVSALQVDTGGAVVMPQPDGLLFVGGDPLVVVDVADHRHPRVIGKLSGAGGTIGTVSGTTALLVGWDTIRTVDVSDPQSPRLLGSGHVTINASETGPGNWGEGRTTVIDGCTAYVLGDGVLRRIDLSSLARPVETEHYVIPGTELALRDGLLLVAAGDRGMWILRDDEADRTGCTMGSQPVPTGD